MAWLFRGTELSLEASIWTENLDRGGRISKQIEAEMVFINGMVEFNPRLPFGGIKKSGVGRGNHLLWIKRIP